MDASGLTSSAREMPASKSFPLYSPNLGRRSNGGYSMTGQECPAKAFNHCYNHNCLQPNREWRCYSHALARSEPPGLATRALRQQFRVVGPEDCWKDHVPAK